MRPYLDACREIVANGTRKQGRNGDYFSVHGMMMKFDLQDGFPAVTTKHLNFKSVVAELLGFIRGADNAKIFRELGTGIWDANANDNQAWLKNPNRKGTDDLGRIYSKQWRDWKTPVDGGVNSLGGDEWDIKTTDQLKNMVDKLCKGVDDRRNIVMAWNPGELDQMALPCCHAFMQSHIRDGSLDLTMYQRSCDMALGVPYNIASYATLIHILCRISGLSPGVFTWMGGDCHLYGDHVELMSYVQLQREPLPLSTLRISGELKTLEDFETATTDSFELLNYDHYPAIRYPFSV